MGLAEGWDSVGQPSLRARSTKFAVNTTTKANRWGRSFDVFMAASVFVVMIVDVVLLSISQVSCNSRAKHELVSNQNFLQCSEIK